MAKACSPIVLTKSGTACRHELHRVRRRCAAPGVALHAVAPRAAARRGELRARAPALAHLTRAGQLSVGSFLSARCARAGTCALLFSFPPVLRSLSRASTNLELRSFHECVSYPVVVLHPTSYDYRARMNPNKMVRVPIAVFASLHPCRNRRRLRGHDQPTPVLGEEVHLLVKNAK